MGREHDHSRYQHWIDPNKVKPYERNAKIHTEKQIRNIANSISRFGWQQDVVVTSDNVLVIGHGRREAAILLGCDMPYHVIDKKADELTDEDIRELRIADNQVNAETGMDMSILYDELEDLDFEGFDFEGFDFAFETAAGQDWFDRKEKEYADREDGNDEYNAFVEKFEPKKTTDDCYTPDIVYDAVAGWVEKEFNLNKNTFVRPFYPGGDYQKYKYCAGAVVVDNPPFSILAEIIRFYSDKGITFFLFAPTLTLFSSSSSSSSCCSLPCGGKITYENGAVVATSFVTNLYEDRVRVIPELFRLIEAADAQNQKQYKKQLPKYKYPDEVLTAAMCRYMCEHDTPLVIKKEDSYHIRQLESQKEYNDSAIFGSGFLLSEKAAAEKAAAEKAAAEKASAHVWELSEKEREIIKSLGHK